MRLGAEHGGDVRGWWSFEGSAGTPARSFLFEPAHRFLFEASRWILLAGRSARARVPDMNMNLYQIDQIIVALLGWML